MSKKDGSGSSDSSQPKQQLPSQTDKPQALQPAPKPRRSRGNRPLRFVCPLSITSIKHRLVLDAFTTIFEQFPRKIAELKALKSGEQYRLDRSDIFTDLSIFVAPPSLRAIQKQQENESKQQKEHSDKDQESKQPKVNCNCNRQADVFLTYDGYIKANSHLVSLVTKLESYYDFYSNWWIQFNYAIQLMKPQLQDEHALEADIQDATMAALNYINSKMSSFIDSVDICMDRFNGIVKMQQSPHIEDYRIDFTIFERQTWFELCFIAQKLHSFYVLTYDVVAKNYHKLI